MATKLCAFPSSVSPATCILPPGHPADSATRFHRFPRPQLELCTFEVARPRSVRATSPCSHEANRHRVDERGRDYCVPCWGSDDDELAYDHFTVAAVPV